MLHMAAFAGTVSASNDLTPIPAPVDGWAEVQRDRLILPFDTNLVAAMVFGTSIGRAQIDEENFRQVAPIELFPCPGGPTTYPNLALPFYPPSYKRLKKISGIAGLANDPLAVGTNRVMFLWFGDTPRPIENADIWTIFTQFSAVNPNVKWAFSELNLVNNLPTGTYQLVGAVVQNSALYGARFRFRNQTMMMGVPVSQSVNLPQSNVFRRGQLGIWGTFKNTESLYIEYIGPDFSPSTVNVYLDLIKIG